MCIRDSRKIALLEGDPTIEKQLCLRGRIPFEDALALFFCRKMCIRDRSGNVCMLRSGKEAYRSSHAIVTALKAGIESVGGDPDIVNIVEDTTHASAQALMTADGLVDLPVSYTHLDVYKRQAWGQTAVQIAGMDVGEHLAAEGRVQSRTYTKLLETGSEERTAFEVSIMQLLDEEETEGTALP